MASFYSILGFMSVNTPDSCVEGRFDVISSLPLEVASSILRLLPAKDLLSAVSVCRKWMEICKSDNRLRKRIRYYLRKMRKARFATIIRDDFGSRRVADIAVSRAAMKTISNVDSSLGMQYGCHNYIHRADRTQIRYAPYLIGPSGRQGRLSNAIRPTNDRRSTRLRI